MMSLFEIIKQNKFDLILLFFLKLISCTVIYLVIINFLNESPLKYPDLSVYSVCDQKTTNVLYSQLLCLFHLNNANSMYNPYLITLSILINFFISSGYFLLLKDFLKRKGQILYLVLLSLHPFMAIYYPKFNTDIFGCLGIFIIFVYIYKSYKVNNFFLLSSLIIINLRSALIPTFFIFAIINIFKSIFNNRKALFNGLLLLIIIISSFLIYQDFSQSFVSANNFYQTKLLNPIFLLGFREAAANLGIGYLFREIYWYGIVQLSASIILLIFHAAGLFGYILFSLKKNINLLIPLTYLVVPLMGVSHLRYLLPIIPLLIFGFTWILYKQK